MKWLTRLFKKIYTRRIFSDYTGQIFLDRYYLIFPPWNEFLRRLPNIYFHYFHSKVDYIQETEHNHARWCLSIMLSGAYEEIRNGERIKRKAFSMSIMKPTDIHQVITAEANTRTLFFVGPRFELAKFYFAKSRDFIPRENWAQIGINLDRKETPELLNSLERRRRAYAKLMKKKAASEN